MPSSRKVVAALALIAAIVSSAAAPALAAALHHACAAQAHHCSAPTRMAACCCGHDAAQQDSTPAQSRVERQPDHSAVPATPACDIAAAIAPRPLLRIHTSPPHLCRRDLPTLFAVLLI